MGPISEELYWGDTLQDKEDLLLGVEAWTGPRLREREELELPVHCLASVPSMLGTSVCKSSRSPESHPRLGSYRAHRSYNWASPRD